MMGTDLTLSEHLEETARWRQEKAKETLDGRNYKAADRLETLAEQARAANFNQSILDRLEKIHQQDLEAGNIAATERFSAIQSEVFRDVGFRFFPDTVNELLWEWLRRVSPEAVSP